MGIKLALISLALLSGCSHLCPKPEVAILPPETKVEISEEQLKECPELTELVIKKESTDPYIDVLEAHKDTVLKYKECAAGKRDLNKIARKLANKETK